MKLARFPLVLTGIVLLFLYLPIVVLVINSFNESRFGGTWAGFSLKWYERLLHERTVWNAFKNSLIVGISATAISTPLGALAAFSLWRYRTALQRVHWGLMYAPLMIPDVLMGVSLLIFFVACHVPLGLTTVIIAHITFCVSYVAMLARARLQNFDFALVEAALDLGASRFDTFRRVLLPFLAPALLSGALLAFTLSLDDFVVTFFVAGLGITTLPLYVYSMIKFGSPPLINALSTLLLAATFIIVGVTHHITEKK
jgi:spermidine/putrescine transport system permease protein